MHKEDFEVLWFNSKFRTPRYLSFQNHVRGVYVVKVWSQRQKQHPSPRKQPLHNEYRDNVVQFKQQLLTCMLMCLKLYMLQFYSNHWTHIFSRKSIQCPNAQVSDNPWTHHHVFIFEQWWVSSQQQQQHSKPIKWSCSLDTYVQQRISTINYKTVATAMLRNASDVSDRRS
jgi:hypothetical protein